MLSKCYKVVLEMREFDVNLSISLSTLELAFMDLTSKFLM